MKFSKKKPLNVDQTLNNPSNYADFSDQRTAYNDSKLLMGMPSNRSSNIGFVRCDTTYGSHISFVPRSDMHFSTAAPQTLNVLDDYFSSTVTNIIDHGDMLQVPVEGHHPGECQESRITTMEEQQMFEASLAKYCEKVVCATGGTHDDPEFASRLASTYISAIAGSYEKFNIPYYKNSAVVEFRAPVYKGNKIVDYASLFCVVLHCHGKPASKKLGSVQKTYEQGLGVIKKFNAEHGTNIVPDFILGGHFHANSDADYMVSRNIYDSKGKATGTCMHTIRVRSNATLQNSNSNAFNRSFPDVLIPNYTQFDVYFEVNKDFKSNDFNRKPKYYPVVTEFPILNNEGKLTQIATKYSEKRKDINYKEEFNRNLAGKSATDLLSSFESKF